MDWLTVRRTCAGPSASWWLSTLVAPLLAAPLAVMLQPASVKDCQPCVVSPGPGVPTYAVVFDLQTSSAGRRVTSLRVTAGDAVKPAQRLPVTGMVPVGPDQEFFFGPTDIDFDGFLDLMLVTKRGVANASATYWLFSQQTRTFTALGTYPVFRVDAARKRLSTYERNGDAGLSYNAREYGFVKGKLTLLREERQDPSSRPGVYRRVIRERAGGVMRVVKTETVRAPK